MRKINEKRERSRQGEEVPPEETEVGFFNTLCRWIGCCNCLSDGDGIPNLREGVLKNRSCTDLPWVLGMIVFTGVMVTTVWRPNIQGAESNMFFGAQDFGRRTCGIDKGLEDYKFAAFPDPTQFTISVCVETCEYTNSVWGYKSNPFVYWCLPDQSEILIYDAFMKEWASNSFIVYVLDLYKARMVPIYAMIATIVLMIGFLIFVTYFLKLIMKVICIGIPVSTLIAGWYFMKDGGSTDPSQGDATSSTMGIFVVFGGACLSCCLMCCWIPLSSVLDAMQEASRALLFMPHTFLVPLILFPFIATIFIAWLIITIFMFSSGASIMTAFPSIQGNPNLLDSDFTAVVKEAYGFDFVTAAGEKFYDSIDIVNYMVPVMDSMSIGTQFFMNLFWALWGLKFIEYFGFVVVSGCVADWYLDRTLVDNPDENKNYTKGWCSNFCRIYSSAYRTVRYHLGTIAIASLLIALIQTAEFIIMYVKKQLGEPENPFAKVALDALLWIVKCLECILDRCSKSTLVVTAVLGTPFFAGCGKVLMMFFKNMAVMALGQSMIALLCFLVNIIIALAATFIAALMGLGIQIDPTNTDQVSSNALPLLGAFFFSYLVARLLLTNWDSASTTVLVTGIMLEEWYPGEWDKPNTGEVVDKPDSGKVEMVSEPKISRNFGTKTDHLLTVFIIQLQIIKFSPKRRNSVVT